MPDQAEELRRLFPSKRPEENDLNTITLAGRVLSSSRNVTGNGMVLTFDLMVSKMLRSGERKLSRFKVVLFDALAAKHETTVIKDARVLVSGELDETRWEQPGTAVLSREIRVIGRFVQIMGEVVP